MSEENNYPTIKNLRFWYTPVVAMILSFLFITVGQLLGLVLVHFISFPDADFTETFNMYFSFIGIWIIALLFLFFRKKNRYILNQLTTKPKGNTIIKLLLFLLVGIGLNGICILVARINKDIHVYFDRFEIVYCLLMLLAVFVQSGAEEFLCRGYVYQKLRETYRNPWAAIILNSLFFSLGHIFNPGITILAILNLILSGLMFSLIVYYFDSFWGAMAAHTGWNYCQSIIFGLPNSGAVVPYSFFKLDTASAKSSFVYNVEFGVEGTIFACIVLVVACAVIYFLGKKKTEVSL